MKYLLILFLLSLSSSMVGQDTLILELPREKVEKIVTDLEQLQFLQEKDSLNTLALAQADSTIVKQRETIGLQTMNITSLNDIILIRDGQIVKLEKSLALEVKIGRKKKKKAWFRGIGIGLVFGTVGTFLLGG